MWKGKLNICLKWAKLDVGNEWRWEVKLGTYYFCKEKIVELCYWKRIGGFCLKFYFKIDRQMFDVPIRIVTFFFNEIHRLKIAFT